VARFFMAHGVYCLYIILYVGCFLLLVGRHCQSVIASVLHVIQRQKSCSSFAESSGMTCLQKFSFEIPDHNLKV